MSRFSVSLLLGIPLTVIVLAGCAKDDTATLSPTPTTKVADESANAPRDVVNEFYTAWIDYEGNPMTDRLFENSQLVTDAFVADMSDTLASFQNGGVDPVLCAQDKPERISVQAQTAAAGSDRATAVVTETFGSTTVMTTVILERQEGDWKIDKIQCVPSGNVTSEMEDVTASPMAETSPLAPAAGGVGTLATEGEMCGGIAGISCTEGLICQYEGDYPDASGTCVASNMDIGATSEAEAGILQ